MIFFWIVLVTFLLPSRSELLAQANHTVKLVRVDPTAYWTNAGSYNPMTTAPETEVVELSPNDQLAGYPPTVVRLLANQPVSYNHNKQPGDKWIFVHYYCPKPRIGQISEHSDDLDEPILPCSWTEFDIKIQSATISKTYTCRDTEGKGVCLKELPKNTTSESQLLLVTITAKTQLFRLWRLGTGPQRNPFYTQATLMPEGNQSLTASHTPGQDRDVFMVSLVGVRGAGKSTVGGLLWGDERIFQTSAQTTQTTTVGVDIAPVITIGHYHAKLTAKLTSLGNSQLINPNDSEWAAKPFYLCDAEGTGVRGDTFDFLTIAPIALHSKMVVWLFSSPVQADEWLAKLYLFVNFAANISNIDSEDLTTGSQNQAILFDSLIVVVNKLAVPTADQQLHRAIFDDELSPDAQQRNYIRRQIRRCFRSIRTIGLPLLSREPERRKTPITFDEITQTRNRDFATQLSKLANWVLEESQSPKYLGKLRLTTANLLFSLSETIASANKGKVRIQSVTEVAFSQQLTEAADSTIQKCQSELSTAVNGYNSTAADFYPHMNQTIDSCTTPMFKSLRLDPPSDAMADRVAHVESDVRQQLAVFLETIVSRLDLRFLANCDMAAESARDRGRRCVEGCLAADLRSDRKLDVERCLQGWLGELTPKTPTQQEVVEQKWLALFGYIASYHETLQMQLKERKTLEEAINRAQQSANQSTSQIYQLNKQMADLLLDKQKKADEALALTKQLENLEKQLSNNKLTQEQFKQQSELLKAALQQASDSQTLVKKLIQDNAASQAEMMKKLAEIASRPTPRSRCFPGSAKVRTQQGWKSIAQLQLGDFVLTYKPELDQLEFTEFLWEVEVGRENETAEFLKLTMTNGIQLRLTATHKLFRLESSEKWRDVNAEDLQLGDTLGYLNDQSNTLELSTLAAVEKIWETGVFNPLTAEGTMLVDHMYVSCYGQITPGILTYSHSLAHWILSPALWILKNVRNPTALVLKPLALSYAGSLIWLNEYLGLFAKQFSSLD